MVFTKFAYKIDPDLKFRGDFYTAGILDNNYGDNKQINNPCAASCRDELKTLLESLDEDYLLKFAEYLNDECLFSAINARCSEDVIDIICSEIPEEEIPSMIFGFVGSETICFLSDHIKGIA